MEFVWQEKRVDKTSMQGIKKDAIPNFLFDAKESRGNGGDECRAENFNFNLVPRVFSFSNMAAYFSRNFITMTTWRNDFSLLRMSEANP